MVSIDNQVIVSGGNKIRNGVVYEKDIFKLSCVTADCTWELTIAQGITPLQLSVGRDSHVAVAVPDDFVNCP